MAIARSSDDEDIHMHNMHSAPVCVAVLAAVLSMPALAGAQCGTELWSIKTGTDAQASRIALGSPTPTTIAWLTQQPAPTPNDARGRVSPVETTLWSIECTLKMAKHETDSDYHMVLVDGSGNTMIGEIPSPQCVAGGSPFAAGIAQARRTFDQHWSVQNVQLQQFIQINTPVRITGVGFFDRPHGQTGVAPNAVEIHPVLGLEVLGAANGAAGPPAGPQTPPAAHQHPAGPPVGSVGNPSVGQQPVGQSPKHALHRVRVPGRRVPAQFASPGQTVQHGRPHGATAGVMAQSDYQPEHSGDFEAWFGGHGHVHHDELAATIDIPKDAKKATIGFWMHIYTYETEPRAKDTLVVRIKDDQGYVIRTLASYSNLDKCADFQLRTFDVSDLAGKTVDVSFEADEAGGHQTSFLVDDVELVTH